MSHFVVLVIGDDHEKQLAPFHEFECTGDDDEYVQTIDKTEEALAEFATATVRMLKLPDGSLVSPYNDEGNYKPEYLRVPTPEERKLVEDGGPLGLRGDKLPFETSGYGADMRIIQFPEGAIDTSQPAGNHESFAEWAEGWFGAKIVRSKADIDLTHEHKYGYTLVEGDTVTVFDRTNPNRKWDWYQVGGRWTGFFKVRAGADCAVGDPGLQTEAAPRGWADVALKGDIDFETMRRDAQVKAAEDWDRIHELIDDKPPIEPWPHVMERYIGGITDAEARGAAMDEARSFYHAQEGLVALSSAKEHVWDIEPFLLQRDEFIERARLDAIVPFAILMDGQWFERGSMGWWGCVSDEKNKVEWSSMVNQLLDGLAPETLITAVDCHI